MTSIRDMVHDEPRLRLKIATRAAVKAVHGTALAAEIAGTKQQRISDCQLPNTVDFLRLDEAQRIEDDGRGGEGWPHITRAMARHHGFELLPLPGCNAGDSDWHRGLAAVSREVGEAVGAICTALGGEGDDKKPVTAREIRQLKIIEELDEAIAKFAVLKGMALQVLADGEGK